MYLTNKKKLSLKHHLLHLLSPNISQPIPCTIASQLFPRKFLTLGYAGILGKLEKALLQPHTVTTSNCCLVRQQRRRRRLGQKAITFDEMSFRGTKRRSQERESRKKD